MDWMDWMDGIFSAPCPAAREKRAAPASFSSQLHGAAAVHGHAVHELRLELHCGAFPGQRGGHPLPAPADLPGVHRARVPDRPPLCAVIIR
jgi:hypothetical protein